ncbi:hypothetical protein HPP92_023178 [Vanilla planifolia]|uniref:Uncharacterized protein n=1 Tax=Vanilla planifolia TaxID=51239 RepID=A0A835UG07_VANPL|nr:hypothetical protein HPP92_023178 [Vanilla planifolia]
MAALAEKAIGSDNQFIHRKTAPCAQETEYQRDVRKLVDLLSKLNPSAKEFFPSSYPAAGRKSEGRLSADAPIFVASADYCYNSTSGDNSYKDSSSDVSSNNQPLNRRRRYGYSQGRRRLNDRVRRAERERKASGELYMFLILIKMSQKSTLLNCLLPVVN